MTLDMDEIKHIVRTILATYPHEKDWPRNITDQVFQAIEEKYAYLHQYKKLIGGKSEEDKMAVNQQIGRLVKEYTGLEVVGEAEAQLSSLIKTYSELG